MSNYKFSLICRVFIIFILALSGCKESASEPDNTLIYEGKTYHTILIGNKTWLKENLDVGIMINANMSQSNNDTIQKYCYANNPENCVVYGGLYQWNEAMQYSRTAGAKGICPTGWHIPTKGELETLASTVAGNGNSLKAAGWGTGSGAGTNASGFSAFLSGYYSTTDAIFRNEAEYNYYWSSSELDINNAYYLKMTRTDNSIAFFNDGKRSGMTVRCLKD